MTKNLLLLCFLLLNVTSIFAQRNCQNDGLSPKFLTTQNYFPDRGCAKDVLFGWRYKKRNPIIAGTASFKVKIYGDYSTLIETKIVQEHVHSEDYSLVFPFYKDFKVYSISIQRIDSQTFYYNGHPNTTTFEFDECNNFAILNVSTRPGYTGIGCWDFNPNSNRESIDNFANEVSIYTLSGNLISSETFASKNDEEKYLSSMPKGNYIIRNNNTHSFRKISQ
ncbi:T9SS type A sorting domain-containing protein [Aquimarina aggregata]|uniref:T9SS type A sorting domain-containing protein n=1 Tax=Aquimarina aggregata TaxID=1642818 RepID=UPI002492D753|nr:T9SS type A sorting domain-containing protein [Aquimarina aggregata]